ncbi:hypothetical protein [Azonexus sp.]|uniref:hypothetical protein n=1 Tax=Azonexus sp. TaxID=1872668 RepID=UPI0035B30ECC
MLVSLDALPGGVCTIAPDDGADPRIVTLRHAEIDRLRAHIFLHGQRPGTYGLFLEYPHPVPGVPDTEENLPLQKALASLALHFAP